MFTGIIEEQGLVTSLEQGLDSAVITVAANLVLQGVRHGDSIAVSGTCLTVVESGADYFKADVMGQTLKLTTLGSFEPGTRVNLERALAAGDRLGGHIVQGHVEAVAEVIGLSDEPNWRVLRIALPSELAPVVVGRGSITVDGVSLTVSEVSAPGACAWQHWFEVSLIPETLTATTLGSAKPGSRVNLETDILARHVARLQDFVGLAEAESANNSVANSNPVDSKK